MANIKTISNIKQLEESLKILGYDNYKKDTASRVIVYSPDDRKSTLKFIAESLGGKYISSKSGSGWKSSVGAAKVGTFIVLAKPAAGEKAGSVSELDARVFSEGGSKGVFNYHGEDIPVVTFTSSAQLEKSIIAGCKDSKLLGEPVAAAFKDFFLNGKFNWDPKMNPQLLNKLGVYGGEVLVGWVFLKKKQGTYFASNPFKGTPKKFHMPTDPAFSGVDSFIEMADGSFYSLSSKFGAGAKASFFSNLLEKGIKKKDKLKKSVFKDICQICDDFNLEYKKSRDIVYAYGVREILGLGEHQIKNPSDVYTQIVKDEKKTGPEAKLVLVSIKNYKGTLEKGIIDNFPVSVSSFFNRRIAEKLNNDKASIDQMKEILQGKDYWQGNLQIKDWLKGDLNFKWLSSSEAELNLIGSKGSMSDITSKQGWINYELKYT
jgi:hypothetical protein